LGRGRFSFRSSTRPRTYRLGSWIQGREGEQFLLLLDNCVGCMLIASLLQRQSHHLNKILDPTRSREEPLPLDLLFLLHLQTSHPFHSQYSNKSFTLIPLPFISSLSRGIPRSNLSARSVGKQGGGAGTENCSDGTHELGPGSREDRCWNCWRRCLRGWDDGLRVQGGAGLCLSSTRLLFFGFASLL